MPSYLVRHGESGRYLDDADPITASSRQAAKRMATIRGRRGFDINIMSPDGLMLLAKRRWEGRDWGPWEKWEWAS